LGFLGSGLRDSGLGGYWADLPLLRYLATCNQYGYYDCHVPNGFLIQNTQNRDARAINLKLNELIHSIDKAKNQMIDIENLSDLDLDELSARYEKIRSECEERQNRKSVNN
jgi:hypothetical protein